MIDGIQWGYEYGVGWVRDLGSPHRSHMTESEARTWVQEFEDDGGKIGAYVVIRRVVGDWLRYD